MKNTWLDAILKNALCPKAIELSAGSNDVFLVGPYPEPTGEIRRSTSLFSGRSAEEDSTQKEGPYIG
jgi:hypothetical protein